MLRADAGIITDWVIRKLAFRYCLHRSPEGMVCTRRRWHNGLHVSHRGSGWAWGGE